MIIQILNLGNKSTTYQNYGEFKIATFYFLKPYRLSSLRKCVLPRSFYNLLIGKEI